MQHSVGRLDGIKMRSAGAEQRRESAGGADEAHDLQRAEASTFWNLRA